MPSPGLFFRSIIARDSGRYALVRVVSALAGLAGLAVYTRFLTVSDYGACVLSATGAYLVSGVGAEWVARGVLRYLEEHRRKGLLPEFVSSALALTAAVAFVCLLGFCLAGWGCGRMVPPRFRLLAALAAVLAVTEMGYGVVLALWQAMGESRAYAARAVWYAVFQVAFAAGCLCWAGAGPAAVLGAVALSGGLVVVWDAAGFFRRGLLGARRVRREIVGTLGGYGCPLVFSTAVDLALPCAGPWLVGALMTVGDAGVYASGMNLAGAIVRFPSEVLLLAATPLIMKTYRPGRESAVRALLGGFTALLAVLLAPLACGAALCAPEITRLLLGEGFGAARAVFPWALAGAFLYALAQYAHKPFELRARTGTLSALLAGAALAGLAAQRAWIAPLGIAGAAAGVCAGYLLYAAAVWTMGRRLIAWPFPRGSVAKAAGASLGMVLALFAAPSPFSAPLGAVLWKTVLGTCVYAGLLLLLKEPCAMRARAFFRPSVRRGGGEAGRGR